MRLLFLHYGYSFITNVSQFAVVSLYVILASNLQSLVALPKFHDKKKRSNSWSNLSRKEIRNLSISDSDIHNQIIHSFYKNVQMNYNFESYNINDADIYPDLSHCRDLKHRSWTCFSRKIDALPAHKNLWSRFILLNHVPLTAEYVTQDRYDYITKWPYAWRPWLLRHCFSLYSARLSSCLTLSFDRPKMFPMSESDLSSPSSMPYLSLMIRLSLGLSVLRRLRTCRLINCLETLRSGISTPVSAVISCKRWLKLKRVSYTKQQLIAAMSDERRKSFAYTAFNL